MTGAIVVGAGGQDGKLLHQRLQREGINVTRLGRGDIAIDDEDAVADLVRKGPCEIYYLAAHHHSSQEAMGSCELDLVRQSTAVHVTGLACFLEAIRLRSRETRLFYAGSSLVFGEPGTDTQDEMTPFDPRCVYGITKAAGLRLCRYYREKHGVFASGGILFNHESLLRQSKFVIPKIIHAALAIARGSAEKLRLGDLSARVDWGYAPDYVEAMTRILRIQESGDFVVATGETHSVQEVVDIVFGNLGLDWREHVEVTQEILTRCRSPLCGNASKLHAATGWEPTITFKGMLNILLKSHDNG
ncbi:MAG: GDP-mannose 4,6-dehydratase [Verrucomicrobiota bacterium]